MSTTPIAIAVVCDDNRILIGRRPPGVPLSGFWEFPGGKVQDGESVEAAAVRECREETGIDVEVARRLAVIHHEYDHGRIQLSFYQCCQTNPTQSPSPPFKWVAAKDLGHYQFPPANDEVLAHLARLFN